MKKIDPKLLVFLIITFIISSCGDEKKDDETKHLTNEEVRAEGYVNLDTLTESQLKDRVLSLERIMLDSATLNTNRENSIKLLEAANKFGERFESSSHREGILYRGTLAARGLEKYHEVIRIFDVLIKDYAKSERFPEYLYEKAHVLDEYIQNNEKAKRIYTQLSEEFPNHHYGQQSKDRLVTIDMTDEELIEYFKTKNALQ